MDNQMNDQNKPTGGDLVIPEEIKSYLVGLMQDGGMTNLDEGMQEEMIKELYLRLDNFLTSQIVENMPPEHLEEFTRMNEQGKGMAEVQQFMLEKMPNAQDVLTRAFMDFRSLYLGNVAVGRLNQDKNQ